MSIYLINYIDLDLKNTMEEHDINNNNNNIHSFNEWVNAFRGHDISKMVSLVTDDVRINSIIFGTYKGKDEASKYWQELYDVFPDININPITITADQHRIATEIDVRGTQKTKAASHGLGNNFDIRGAFIYDFTEDASINEIRMYYDSGILKKQLDIHDGKNTSPQSAT
jgi:steroid delta-isomerase-like uncharacterized protein